MQNSEDMAKAFLDQWQQQWTGLAADPAWQQMAQQQWQQFAQSMMMTPMPPAFAGAGSSPIAASDKVKPNDDARSPPTASASDLGAQLLAECFMRMARLEARLADLESRVKT